jgi:20S proteasome alpha/beta subunit
VTLIIGIKCSDGIVVGADGAATLGALGTSTVRQPTKKLDILMNSVIVGVSGPVGLGQRIRGEIEALYQDKKLSNKKPFEAMTIMRETLWKHVSVELQAAASASQAIGPVATRSALCSTLVALAVAKSPCLFQFDQQCAPEEATSDLPFVAIGSGQQIADPFLALLRRVFWKDVAPSIADGIFATFWILDHAIRTHPGGVAEPKQIAVLHRENGTWFAKELSPEELKEHEEAVAAAEASLANFRKELQQPGTQSDPPKPNQS